MLDSVYWMPVPEGAIGLGPGHHLAEFLSVTMLHAIHPALVPMSASLGLLYSTFWWIFELTDKERGMDST